MYYSAKMCILSALAVVLFVDFAASTNQHSGGQFPKSWTQNLQTQIKLWSREILNYRRDLSANTGLDQGRHPVGVMKMGFDESEKFFPEYWLFNENSSLEGFKSKSNNTNHIDDIYSNTSMVPAFRTVREWNEDDSETMERNVSRALKRHSPLASRFLHQKRDFICPTGTSDCSGIGFPNSCCPNSDKCFAIEDTGLGPVGCCRNGSNCGSAILNCNAPNTACSADLGGGCCIRNYICAGIGCVITPTVVISTLITITTATPVSSGSITTTPTPSISCNSNSQPHPESIGGSQCSEERTCAPGTNCNSSSGSLSNSLTTTEGVPPHLTSMGTVIPSGIIDSPTCPTGFYGCNAFHAGGCCRTGRDCDTTSCPPKSSTSLVSDGLTIVVPVGTGASVASPLSTCAVGWASCGASEGNGCCPSGWKCGSTDCSDVGAKATTTISKEHPSYAEKMSIKIRSVITSIIVVVVALDVM